MSSLNSQQFEFTGGIYSPVSTLRTGKDNRPYAVVPSTGSKTYTVGFVKAIDKETGVEAGGASWRPGYGDMSIGTHERYRGQGVASRMVEHARGIDPAAADHWYSVTSGGHALAKKLGIKDERTDD